MSGFAQDVILIYVLGNTPSRKIKPQDLIEFCVDEVRDFELLDYQYPSGSQRKKAESKLEKKSNGSTKDTIAA